MKVAQFFSVLFLFMITLSLATLFSSESSTVAVPEQGAVAVSESNETSHSFFDLSSWKTDSTVSWIWLLFASFLAGILISFTPCVYPMIPITAAIMQNYSAGSMIMTMLRAFIYIMGIALVYASFGYFSASTSMMFGSWMASPWIVGIIAAFYLYCVGAMFDWYDLYIPSFLGRQHGFASNGSFVSVFLYGLLAGMAASPCITPGLSLILGVVSQLKNPVLGFAMLFVFALGMSFLLLLVSMSTNLVHRLPSAGIWMLEVKKIFGFLLLGMLFSFVRPFLSMMHVQIVEVFLLGAIICFYGLQLQKKIRSSIPASVPVEPMHATVYSLLVCMYISFIMIASMRMYYLLVQFFTH
jgi:thiol:disulfide interchange protein DsbD